MGVTQYVGARYVPLFADPAEWDKTKVYEPLTIVLYQGNSYTSRQTVPVGIDINNDEFWVLTGNYNAQVEQYRKDVVRLEGEVDAEIERATSEEKALDTKIDSEIERAKTEESEIEQNISDTADKITESYKAADSAIETAYKKADSDIITKYDKEVSDIHDILTDESQLLKNEIETRQSQVSNTYKNVSYFGAVGDGVTDDTAALQNALNSKYNLIFDCLTYAVSELLNLTNQENKYLVGNGATIKLLDSARRTTAKDSDFQSILNIDGCNYLNISNLNIDANCGYVARPETNTGDDWDKYTEKRKQAYNCIDIKNCNYPVITNMYLTHGCVAMMYRLNNYGVIKGVKIYQTEADGIMVRDTCANTSISNCIAVETQDDTFDALGFSSTDSENKPLNTVYDSCIMVNGRGAMFCFEGSENTTASNCVSYGARFTPFKAGSYTQAQGKYSSKGKNQLINNCVFNLDSPLVSNTATNGLYMICTSVNSIYNDETYRAEAIKVDNCVFNINNRTTQKYYIDFTTGCSITNCVFNDAPFEVHLSKDILIENNKFRNTQFVTVSDSVFNNNVSGYEGNTSWFNVFYNVENMKVLNNQYIGTTGTSAIDTYKNTFTRTDSTVRSNIETDSGVFTVPAYNKIKLRGITPLATASYPANYYETCVVSDNNKLYTNVSGSWVEL